MLTVFAEYSLPDFPADNNGSLARTSTYAVPSDVISAETTELLALLTTGAGLFLPSKEMAANTRTATVTAATPKITPFFFGVLPLSG